MGTRIIWIFREEKNLLFSLVNQTPISQNINQYAGGGGVRVFKGVTVAVSVLSACYSEWNMSLKYPRYAVC